MTLKDVPSLSIMDFLSVDIECKKKEKKNKANNKDFLLDNFSKCLSQDELSDVYLSYDDENLYCVAHVLTSFKKSFYPDYHRGDCLEVFINTRPSNESYVVTKFCHHFIFFPQQVEGLWGKEITKFRNDDMHENCSSKDLEVEVEKKNDSYIISCSIPFRCLHGFEIQNFEDIGFSYRINIADQLPLDFVSSSFEYPIERLQLLWANVKFKGKK